MLSVHGSEIAKLLGTGNGHDAIATSLRTGDVWPQIPSTGLRHPSLEEGAGKRCSECGLAQASMYVTAETTSHGPPVNTLTRVCNRCPRLTGWPSLCGSTCYMTPCRLFPLRPVLHLRCEVRMLRLGSGRRRSRLCRCMHAPVPSRSS